MWDGGCEMLLAEQKACEEMDKWFLNPGLAEDDEQDEDEQMDGTYDEEGHRHAREVGEPEGEGEGEIHHHSDDDKDKDEGQSGRLHQAHHFVDHIQLQIFRLKPEIMLEHLDELRNRLYILVTRQHRLFLFGSILDVVHQVDYFLAAELDVVLLHEVLYGISNLYASV